MLETRECNNPYPAGAAGLPCPGPEQRNGTECPGLDPCPVPVNGSWSGWADADGSECSATCGGGVVNQTRDCDDPEPEHGGLDCQGDGQRMEGCNNHTCPCMEQTFFAERCSLLDFLSYTVYVDVFILFSVLPSLASLGPLLQDLQLWGQAEDPTMFRWRGSLSRSWLGCGDGILLRT